jgi:hypothetical protein
MAKPFRKQVECFQQTNSRRISILALSISNCPSNGATLLRILDRDMVLFRVLALGAREASRPYLKYNDGLHAPAVSVILGILCPMWTLVSRFVPLPSEEYEYALGLEP